MTPWLLLLLGVVLTLGTALFVAAEFSLVALDRPAVQRAADAGEAGARSVLVSHRQLSTQLSACQVGITLTTLVLGFIASPSVGELLVGPLGSLGLGEGAASSAASVLAMLVATVFSMIVGEMVPKTLAVSLPMATAKISAGPVRWFGVVATPLIAVLNGVANRTLHALGIEPQEELSAARSPAELASLVRTSAEAGTLDHGTARLVTASLGFADQTAADVMTPRSRATSIDRTASAADLVTLARRTGHSRFPVLGSDWDDVDGIVHVKKAIAVPFERRADVPVSALMTEAVFVPETLRLDPLLVRLRVGGMQLAVVVDEYGGTSGVVTLEDLVEEIVGEVSDEHDRGQTTGRRLPDGSWTVPGLWRPDEVRSRVGVEVPEGPAYETVGGYVMAALGRVPRVGDEVVVDGWTARVVDMEGHRVDRVRLLPTRPVLAPPADGRSGGESS
ncbi:HlyC/CorC family transporter [Phycicoccus endophyticus]|uniref:HlyC/CorC family transporter n=1 Tax=Phycicoccus endophyticus TaxID=1690220 RepID=A0A7G9QYP4_9MICO|nr:hemolysin family protein [Phycicoccus endophyticus]NHI20495.1 HlyC/CorC family transporter [Phycicoccus endophyticus]QNN48469.1 HlyC/CorC family transporter [Phycicoccus endophyticus]GGL30271.1 membrane protein [Phycicoccus endophyticus]